MLRLQTYYLFREDLQMNFSIERDSDFSDYEVTTRQEKPDKHISITRETYDYDAESDTSQPAQTMHTNLPKPKALEGAGMDLLVNDTTKLRIDDADRISVHSNASGRSYGSGSPKQQVHVETAPSIVYEQSDFRPSGSEQQRFEDTFDTRSEVSYEKPRMSQEAINAKKRAILYHLKRMENRGVFVGCKFTMSTPLEEMEYEYERIKEQDDADKAIEWYRTILLGLVTGGEHVNRYYSPYKLNLDGWTDTFQDHVDNYDDVMHELHIKYRSRFRFGPEIRLLGLVAGTGLITHINNTLFRTAPVGNMADVAKERPDLMAEVQAASMESAARKNPGIGDIFSMLGMMGAKLPGFSAPQPQRPAAPPQPQRTQVPQQQQPPPFTQPPQQPRQTQQPPQRQTPPPQPKPPQQAREMQGPSDIEEMLNLVGNRGRHAPVTEDARSVHLSEVNDLDRISEVSSLNERDLKASERNILSRPNSGIRETHRNAFINKMNDRKKRKNAAPTTSLVVEL